MVFFAPATPGGELAKQLQMVMEEEGVVGQGTWSHLLIMALFLIFLAVSAYLSVLYLQRVLVWFRLVFEGCELLLSPIQA